MSRVIYTSWLYLEVGEVETEDCPAFESLPLVLAIRLHRLLWPREVHFLGVPHVAYGAISCT